MSHAERQVRHVNGCGPRCGCGGRSVVHFAGHWHDITPDVSTFLCRDCIGRAVDDFMSARDQAPYWPGDEGRDETYEKPA